jgi:uncharacterized protein DUF3276
MNANAAPALRSQPQTNQKSPPKVLFQTNFKSVGPRSYSAQVKEASNGNQFLVLSETKPARDSGELRSTSVYVFSEDFDAFWNLLRDAARFIKDHPMPEEKRKQRDAYWKTAAQRNVAPANARQQMARNRAIRSAAR